MIFCNYTLYNGKVYDTYFDKENLKVRFFSNGVEVDGDILLELNNKYNKKPDKQYKFIGTNKLLIGIVAANIVIASIGTGLVTDFKNDPVDQTPSYAVEQVIDGDFYEQLYEAAGDNKDFVETLSEPIENYSEYLQKESLLNTIGSLEISKEDDSVFDDDNIVGYYDKYANKIVINPKVSDYEETNVLAHEKYHYLSQGGFSVYDEIFDGYIGSGIDEGMTQILANEEGNYSNSYAVNVCYVQALTELVGRDKMLEAYYADDGLYTLIDELSNYMSEDDAYSMIKNVDMSIVNHMSYSNTNDEEDLINMENCAQEFWRIYEEAYYDKTGIKVSDDALLTACKTGTTFVDEEYGLDYIRYVEITKPYFNPNLINNTEDYQIYYCCDDSDYCIDMNEDIRFNDKDTKTK